MSEPGKAVFLSYASQDAEAAKRIAEALRAAGIEVWFDQNELVGGDAWDAKIRKQIAECALFVPVISASTQARLEGYFRIEWKIAARRTHAMAAAKAFLLPVVIDATRDAEAHVPDEFREVQWTRLPGGGGIGAFCARVRKLLGGADPEPGQPRAAERGGDTAAPPAGVGDYVREVTTAAKESHGSLVARSTAAWRRLSPVARVALSVVFALAGLAIGLLLGRDARKPSPAAPAASAAAQASEAQKLVAQARKIYDEGDELDRENLLLAEDLVKRALALDPTEPSAWLLAAQLSYWLVWHSSDNSEERRSEMLRQAARARALAPDSVAAQVAQANARIAMAYNNSQSAGNRQDLVDLERELLLLAERAPRDPELQRSLSQTYRFLRRPDDALRALRLALELSGGDAAVAADLTNTLIRRKNYAEAEALVGAALSRRASGRLRMFDVLFKNQWRGDLTGAQAALDGWPGWLLREDRGAFIAWQTWLWSRQPDRALDVVQRLPRDYLRDVWFTGPRSVLTARAHELAGHREAALTDWHTAVQLADRELASSPGNAPALFWKAWALSRLGDQPGADAAVTLLQQNMGTQTVFFNTTNLASLWSTLGRTDQAFAHLRAWASAEHDGHAVTRAMLELDPAYEALRRDPRFAALAAAALAPAPTSATAPTDDKSVAVLAFTNLSEDKSNEYFSDGISEELLNVLAKVPGLKVAARTSAFYFKGKQVPVAEIARQLDVAYVVEGSVRKAGDQVRIQAQLVKAADGFRVWSETFTRDLKDMFAVQDEIAARVAGNLRVRLEAGPPREGIDPARYERYLEARSLARRESNADSLRAVALLTTLVREEPKWADAWAELARAQVQLGRFGGRPLGEALADARAAAERALALDPDHVTGLVALGWVRRTADWDWKGADRLFERAQSLAPGDAVVLADAAVMNFNLGRVEKAVALGRQAADSDPLSARVHAALGFVLQIAGRYEEALGPLRRAVELAPGIVEVRTHQALALGHLGRLDEAERVLATEPGEAYRLIGTAFLRHRRGDAAGHRAVMDDFVARFGAEMPGYAAVQYALAGDTESAFAWLDRAVQRRDAAAAWVKTNSGYRSLHAEPRWPALLRKLGLADDQLH